ncbi:MAG: ATP-binding protein, partial [Candidatus Poribacteria bacterium]
YPEDDGTVWFGGSEGIARFVPDIPKDYTQDYSTLIRKVRGIAADSVFYHGASFSEPPYPEIEHKNNSLRFEFAAASYDDVSANLYQFKLEGFDQNWSNWTNETKKDYTGLPAGDYTFRVRARNVYDHQSSEGKFSFTILPPWYQTWWAYLFYALAASGLLALIVKGRVRHLEKKTKELEAVVSARTTQIVEQKNKIEEQAEKLREADKMKSRFFANISHEFRTPLTLILGPLEERISKARKKADKEELSMMYRSAHRVLQLINQLLDLSRLESGKMKLNAGRGDFSAFLKGIVMSFASLAEQKKITLKIEIPKIETPRHFKSAGEFSEVYFDPDKIEKIFYNLLSNAFKFTPAGGEIRVRVQVPGTLEVELPGTSKVPGSLEVTIKDTGIGIPADRLPHIFNRFYQVDGSTTREHEGTGIGLALTKELVELHHGNIEVESKKGHGTTITVRLPIGKEYLNEEEIVSDTSDIKQPATSIQQPASSIKEPATSIQQPASSSEDIILIVDDHPDVRKYIRKHLESEYQVIEAKDGSDGVAAATETIPDLVISDVMMPKMDGYQLCKALKTNEKTSHIPVILLTAKAGESDKLEGLEIGADDYLSKPFNSKELHARVHNLIEVRRQLRERFRREGLLQPREVEITSVEEAFLQKLMSVIEKNLAEEDFNPEALSNQLHMGLRQLQRKIRALTEQTPSDFIRTIRLQRAKQMLEQGAGTVSEIAYQVGFNDLSYFSKSFRKEFGRLPSEVVKK